MKYFFCLFLMVCTTGVFCQISIKSASVEGILLDTTTKKPIEFATIAIIDPQDNHTIDGTVTDEKGSFEIKNLPSGSLILEMGFLGYQTKRMNISLKDGAKLKLTKLFLSQEVVALKEVTIEGQSQVIEEKVDRLVYNAEKDITSKGGDASDVMRNVPLLTVDLDGNVSLRGSSNVKVLINNKPSSIMAGSVADALKQIPADMIKSIEVITSPTARYESEGSSGIINIITKKNTLQGMTLGVDVSAGNRGAMLGLNGNYRKGNMGFSLRGHGRGEYNIKGGFENLQTSITSSGLQTTSQTANTLTQRLHGNYNLGWDWDLTKKSNLSAGIRFGTRSGISSQDNMITSVLFPGSTSPLLSGRNVDSKDISLSYDINATYTYTYNSQKELSFLGLYSRNNRTNDWQADLYNNVDFATITSRQKNENPSYNEESTAEINYNTPLTERSMIEFGGKGIFRKVYSDFSYYFSEGATSDYEIDLSRKSNTLDYTQNVAASYLSYTYTTRNKFSFKAGSRLEYTSIAANFENKANGTISDIPSYWNLIPSINISKPITKTWTMRAAYNKRIQRPGIQFLNPNVNEANPNNISVGNPNLSPELTDNFELTNSLNIKNVFLTAAVFYRHTGNSITSLRDTFSIFSGSTYIPAIRTTYENIGNENTIGFNAFGNVTLFKIWSLNGGFDVYNVSLSNNNPNPNYSASNNGWVVGGRMFTNLRFKNGWGIQGGGGARGRQINLQGYSGSFAFYSIGVRKNFLNGKGNFSISAENFLNHPFRVNSSTTSNLLNQLNTNSFYNSGVRMGINYRFGKMTFEEKRKKSINNDDIKSEGAGGQGGGGNDSGSENQNAGGQRTGGQRTGGTMPSGAQSQGQRPNGQTGQQGNWQQGNNGQRPGVNPQQGTNQQNAQGNQPRPQGMNTPDPKVMHDTLKLNIDQIKSFDEINSKYGAKIRTMMEESRAAGLSREESRAKMDSIRAEQEAELKTILTEEQLILYKKINAERAARFQQGGMRQ